MRISDLSPSIKGAGGADGTSGSIEKVAERVRNSTLKLFPISCTVNVYCRAAARGSHTSHRSLSVLLQANQKLTERENKRKKHVNKSANCECVLKHHDQGRFTEDVVIFRNAALPCSILLNLSANSVVLKNNYIILNN